VPPPPGLPTPAAPSGAAPLVVTPTEAAARPPLPAPTPARLPEPSQPLAELLPNAVRVIQTAAERGTIPVALILLVAIFLAVQDRIDRRDPKLALAPLRDEPEYLEFNDPRGAAP
jgi:hypothetical protein